MDTIDGLKAVIAVANTGGFTQAAKSLGLSKALVSKYVAQIEHKRGVRLFNRTTRSVTLTEFGQQFCHHARNVLASLEVLDDSMSSASPEGLLRISAPISFCEHLLAALLVEFNHLYPKIAVELIARNHAVDMVQDGIDIRIKAGTLNDSSYIARQFATSELVLVASPKYLSKYQALSTPNDLVGHMAILDSNHGNKVSYCLTNDDEDKTVELSHQLSFSTPTSVMNCAIAGGGIGMVPKFLAQAAFEKGRLARLLPNWQCRTLPVFAMYPHRDYVPTKVRVFIDFLLEKKLAL